MDISKAKIVKDVVLNLFPLVIEKAVQGCRYINNIISDKVTIEGRCYHRYDEDEGAVKEAKDILRIESNLIDMYKKYLKYKEQDSSDMLHTFNKLSYDWCRIAFETCSENEIKLIDEALSPLLGDV